MEEEVVLRSSCADTTEQSTEDDGQRPKGRNLLFETLSSGRAVIKGWTALLLDLATKSE